MDALKKEVTATPLPQIRDILFEMVERKASDLHITAGNPPMFRIHGEIAPSQKFPAVLSSKETHELIYTILSEAQRKKFETSMDLDFSFGIQKLSRFRGNVFKQRNTTAAVIRQIPFHIRTIKELGLPPVVDKLAERPRGLILVTGPTGSGKSTTMAAILDKINTERQGHIITVEDPIEFVHAHKNCIVNQREVGVDTESFATALKYALREDPDVILVGELRDLETIHAALTIAETGHLCLATLHTNSAPEAINRIIDVFPPEQQTQVRTQLSAVLEGIVTQILVPIEGGKSRALCTEIMVATAAVRNLIREGKTQQLYSAMQSGKEIGMQTMNEALKLLVMDKKLEPEEAIRLSSVPTEMATALAQYMKPIPLVRR
jgi:twitching motility protein PilT